jgi:parallel beta-helix repeat protein
MRIATLPFLPRGLGPNLLALLCFGFLIAPSSAQTIVVSKSGRIHTLEQARDEARRQHAAGVEGTIAIMIEPGTYYLAKTLTLGPEDSNTVWEAAHGSHPVISGGRVISGWTRGSGKVWSADAPGVYFRQLFVNGRRVTRARTPNYGFFRIDGDSSRATPFQLHFRGDDIKKKWAENGDVEVVALLAWSDLRMPIATVDEASHVATLTGNPAASNHEQDARYFIENAPDALDAPGEWFLDRASAKVSYIPLPGEDLTHALVEAPSLTQLISIRGDTKSNQPVLDITFRGLTFEHADWTMNRTGYADTQAAMPAPAAIETSNTTNLVFDHCTIAHSGGYGLWLGQGTKDSKVLASELFDLGAGGIRLGDYGTYADPALQSYRNIIAGNNIHDLGQVYAAGVGILVLQSAHNRIVHNHIHDLFYTGISAGWTWGYADNQSYDNLIAFNHIHDIGKQMLSDMGGIYTLGKQPGTVVRNNLIHDISSFTYGGWGIYTDEGSSNILIEDNITYNCKSAGFHQHYGQDNIVRNNIFAFNQEAELMRTRSEPHNSFTMEHNIVYFNRGALLGGNWEDKTFTMRSNLYFDTRGESINFAGRSFAQWQAEGEDDHSIIADPLFVNAGNYDFRLRPQSPALKLRFHPIDMSTVGPRMPAGADSW